MKIVFMGTPDYAVKTLEALIKAGHNVEAVFAQPDKPVGRKHIITPPPVKVCAVENNIPVFQPNTLKDGEAEKVLKEAGFMVSTTKVLGVLVPHTPGGLADVLQIFTDGDISVEYLYSFVNTHGGNALIMFKVDPAEKAIELLKQNGIELITQEQVNNL